MVILHSCDPQIAKRLSTHAQQALARLQWFQTATHVYRTAPVVDLYGRPGIRRCSGRTSSANFEPEIAVLFADSEI